MLQQLDLFPDTIPEAIMLKVGGKPFRCECGANVFHHPPEKPKAFECNGCGTWWVGEK